MFTIKIIREKWLHLEGKHVVVWTNIWYYPHSEIISLITLNAMIQPMSHIDWLNPVLVRTRWLENRSLYRSGLASFTTSNKSKCDRYFYAPLLPSISLCYPQIQLKNVIKNILTKKNQAFLQTDEQLNNQKWYKKPQHFERHDYGPVTCKLTWYSTGTNKVIKKQVDLPQWLGLLNYGNQINKCLVFWCSPLTFDLYVLNVTQLYI